MDIGSPLPADLAEIDARAVLNSDMPAVRDAAIKSLHVAHANFDEEIGVICAKKIAVKNVLNKLYANRDLANLASFDTIVKMPESLDMTPEGAAELLKNVAKGVFQFPAHFIEQLKSLAGRIGKGE